MFEIAIAGAAALAGLMPQLGGEPDVLFEFEDRRILVQCKRVLSDNAVPKRIAEATRQLTRDLSTNIRYTHSRTHRPLSHPRTVRYDSLKKSR
jgi:hypothetical protein